MNFYCFKITGYSGTFSIIQLNNRFILLSQSWTAQYHCGVMVRVEMITIAINPEAFPSVFHWKLVSGTFQGLWTKNLVLTSLKKAKLLSNHLGNK